MTDAGKPSPNGPDESSDTPEKAAPTPVEDAETAALPVQDGTEPEKAEETPARPRRGRVTVQDETTEVRQESLGDRRARQVALRKEREAAIAAEEEAEARRKLRKRIMIGAGVTVGVAAVVAVIYASSTPDEVTASCVDSNGVVVDDDYCDDSYATSHGGYSSGGFIYIGGSSYRYNYGGTGTKGQKVTGGSYVAPSSGTSVKTSSGKSVQRGGLGVSGGGKSGGS